MPLPGGDVPWDSGAVPLPDGADGAGFADPSDINFDDEGDGAFAIDTDEKPTRAYDVGILNDASLFDPQAEPSQAPTAPAPTAPPPVASLVPPPPAPPGGGFDFGALPDPSPDVDVDTGDFGAADAPAEPTGFDFGTLPPPPADVGGEAPEFSFGDSHDASADDAGRPGFDFGAFPEPSPASTPGTPAPSFDFGDLPSPGAPTGGTPAPSFDFGDLPAAGADAPAAAPAFDFGDLPAAAGDAPAAAPAFDFGDLPDPGQAPSLDFDAPAAAPAFDFGDSQGQDVADFGAVDLGGGGPALDLDGAAAAGFSAAGAAGGYSVRRRSGKVFGPFDPPAIVQMLQDGQLLGNEDVSGDGENWEPIGSVEPFAGTIQQLMSSAGAATGTAGIPATRSPVAPPQLGNSPVPGAPMQGRMAAIAIADPATPADKEPSRVGRYIGIGVAVLLLLVVGAGVGLGLTPYGYFGLKKLMPATIAPGTQEAKALGDVHAALLSGTRSELIAARDGAARILAIKEFPELRAAWGEAVFLLHRNYGEGAGDRNKARDAIAAGALAHEGSTWLIKLRAASALDNTQGSQARSLIQGAPADGREDPALLLSLAEAHWQEKDLPKARGAVERALKRAENSARAHHLLGLLALAQADQHDAELRDVGAQIAALTGEEAERREELVARRDGALEQAKVAREKAAQAFGAALQANPKHLLSAVTLASLELAAGDATKALQTIAPAIAEDAEAELSNFLRAEALSIAGSAHLSLGAGEEAESSLQAALEADPDHGRAQAALGRIFFERRAYEDALPLFQAVSKRDPQNLEAAEGLISALLATGKHVEARKQVESANERFMGSAGLAYLYGRVEDALGNALDAETHYKRALASDPELHEAALYLARFYLRSRRPADAEALLEAPLKVEPLTPLMRVAKGELELAKGELEDAAADFTKAFEEDPELADAVFGRSRVRLSQGDLVGALKDAERTLALNPSLPEARLQLGRVLWADGKLEEALTALTRAREESPNSVATAIVLGQVQLDAEKLADAEKTLREALQLDASNPEVLVSLGRVLAARDLHTEAIDFMRQGLARARDNARYHYMIGNVYAQANRPEDAVEAWTRSSQLDPTDADPVQALGIAALGANRYRDAVTFLTRALEIDPERHELVARIGDAHFHATQWDKAIERYREAVRLDPSLTRVYYNIGRAYSESERIREAVPWLRRATVAHPDEPGAFVALGYALKYVGQKGEAAAAFRAYLQKAEDPPDRKDVEDEIYGLVNE